jgi:hypothetical protein
LISLKLKSPIRSMQSNLVLQNFLIGTYKCCKAN